MINNGKISGGYFFSSSSSLINHGSITGGKFLHAISNESSGTIENGTFISVTNNGTINGGIFRKKPEGGHVAKGYTLNVNLQNTGIYKISRATINGLNGGCYIIPNSDHDTSVTIEYTFSPISQPILFPIDVTFGDTNGTPCLLKDWAPSASYSTDHAPSDSFFVTFTAPSTGTDTVTLSMLTRLVIDENGYPVGPMGSNKKYSGNGWNFDASNNTLTLESGNYDFSGSGTALRPLNPDVQLVVEPGAKLTGGAAGDGSGVTWQLTENTDDPSTYTLTIRGSGAMEDYLMSGHQPWRSFRDQITSVVVSPGVTSIGNLAFTRFSKLIHVDIADSVVSIGEHVFSECSSLTNITVPQSVTYIDAYAFDSCTNLSSITLSTNNITSIRPYTFSGCSELSSIVIPDGVTSIQLGAFSNCTKLTSITIPDSVTTIDPWAFKNCSSLTSITIPSSVTSIGSNVFTGCTSLNDIRYSGTSESVISALSDYVPTLVTFDYGDKVPEAERMIKVFVKTGGTLTAPTTIPTVSGYEFKGWLTKDDEPYDFTGAPTGRFTLYANWEKIPDQKPEPTPDPTPETYTLTVKGGTFTYNGGEAMTSANVPVDAEVKVTLNQSAVPEGMVFDLWAMDGASLLGNPAVAYNEESFTIPAGSVAKGSTVTITVTPDSGYVLETISVTDKNGNDLKLTDKGNGKYTFTMPASKVEIKVTFMEDNSVLNFFYDVPNDAYYYEAVKWAAENGITGGIGNGLFGPNQPCTRAQIVTFLWRAAGSPEPKAMSSFSDVSADSYYAKAVAWAVENGITTGTGDGKFSPDATCTRAQSVTFLFRAIGKLVDSKAEFSDVLTDSYYANAVAWAVENGVTNGIGDGLFGPDNSCTRAQIVTFLFRAYQGK